MPIFHDLFNKINIVFLLLLIDPVTVKDNEVI